MKHCPLSAAVSTDTDATGGDSKDTNKAKLTAPLLWPLRGRVLPAGVRSRFEAALGVGLPHAVGELVADGRHDFDELQRPLVQVQRSNSGQVGAQVPVDARTLDADEGAEVQARPVRVWMSGKERGM